MPPLTWHACMKTVCVQQAEGHITGLTFPFGALDVFVLFPAVSKPSPSIPGTFWSLSIIYCIYDRFSDSHDHKTEEPLFSTLREGAQDFGPSCDGAGVSYWTPMFEAGLLGFRLSYQWLFVETHVSCFQYKTNHVAIWRQTDRMMAPTSGSSDKAHQWLNACTAVYGVTLLPLMFLVPWTHPKTQIHHMISLRWQRYVGRVPSYAACSWVLWGKKKKKNCSNPDQLGLEQTGPSPL